MNKIINSDELPEIVEKLKSMGNKIVLVGGCFDILHQGHISFLDKAKKRGDTLMVLLESDASVGKRKGAGKPVNKQTVRAQILSTLPSVDYVLLLPFLASDDAYDKVVLIIKPAIIATTKGDSGRHHKERQAALVDAQVLDVIDRLPQFASSKLAERITTP